MYASGVLAGAEILGNDLPNKVCGSRRCGGAGERLHLSIISNPNLSTTNFRDRKPEGFRLHVIDGYRGTMGRDDR
jgi:hypothetical protein